jgi:toxin ParE1/3/4
MGRFYLSQLAKSDLRAIGRYTQVTWGREQRNRYLTQLDACFDRLAQQPELGRACDDICAGYRKYPIGRHLVFYRAISDGIEIVRVLHERMDIESRLDDD